MQPVTVVVADDHTLVRRGLVSLFHKQRRVKVVGEAADGLEAVDKVRQLDPDVVLMDLKMPRLDGIDATRKIAQQSPRTGVVILTVCDSDDDLLAAVVAGAKGYLLKNATLEQLVRAIETAAAGEVVLSTSIAAKLLREVHRCARGGRRTTLLTRREQEILRLLAKGASNRRIADTLVIAESTVRGHIHNMLDKLQLENRLQAVAYAVREQLV